MKVLKDARLKAEEEARLKAEEEAKMIEAKAPVIQKRRKNRPTAQRSGKTVWLSGQRVPKETQMDTNKAKEGSVQSDAATVGGDRYDKVAYPRVLFDEGVDAKPEKEAEIGSI